MAVWRGCMAEGCAATLPVPYGSGRTDSPTSGRTDGRTADSDWSARWACRGAPVNQAFPTAAASVRGCRTRRPNSPRRRPSPQTAVPALTLRHTHLRTAYIRVSCRRCDFLSINIITFVCVVRNRFKQSPY